ncbi:MAG: exopolysaccharide biosynthesis polyprenyl glycosylphosphotransferase [Bacteroidetes bacterium]|nr:exopolysaccharide biosynthesis polyprenyl glycosylphosphotransferase [Bacteroidota bacterium]
MKMLTKRESTLSVIMVILQTLLSAALFFAPLYIMQAERLTVVHTLLLAAVLGGLWSFFLYRLRLGTVFRERAFASMIRGYATTVFIGVCCLLQVAILYPWMPERLDSIYYCLGFSLVNFLLLILFKYGFYRSMRFMRRKGFNTRFVVIVANSSNCVFISTFDKVKDWGYNLVAIFSDDPELIGRFPDKQFLPTAALSEFMIRQPVDDVFYCQPINSRGNSLQKLIGECNIIGVTLHILQHSEENIHSRYALRSNFNEQFFTYQTVPDKYLPLKIKDMFDLLFSLTALALSLPLFVAIAFLIKLDGGPVFFKQERIGRNGRRFQCYKFRSMVTNAEELKKDLADMNEADGPAFKIKDDPRVTKIGKFLRKTSLDELPQFINVILGDMSIVGPRPPLLSEVQQYDKYQLRRLSMKPGITCSWQVWGRHQVSFNDWVKMDLDYIDNWSIWLDIKIILATIGVIFKANGS